MHRTAAILGFLCSFAASDAGAVIISMSTDKSTYLPGEDLILTIQGDAQGASATGVFVQVVVGQRDIPV